MAAKVLKNLLCNNFSHCSNDFPLFVSLNVFSTFIIFNICMFIKFGKWMRKGEMTIHVKQPCTFKKIFFSIKFEIISWIIVKIIAFSFGGPKKSFMFAWIRLCSGHLPNAPPFGLCRIHSVCLVRHLVFEEREVESCFLVLVSVIFNGRDFKMFLDITKWNVFGIWAASFHRH